MGIPITNFQQPLETIDRKRFAFLFIGGALLLALYAPVIFTLCRFVWETDYQQHVLLVPFISVYLIKRRYQENRAMPTISSSWLTGMLVALAGITAALTAWKTHASGAVTQNDALALAIFSLIVFLIANALLTIGWKAIRYHLFAICFLVFTIPLPDFAVHAISTFLQHTSADVAQLILNLVGTQVRRDGLSFHIKGLDFVVAEECSGIRATFVLFMISLLAGQLILHRTQHKIYLAASVVPIAIIRNGFRIASLTWLTTHVNSRVIDSPLHHRGGPIFFMVGLFPFLGVLWWLQRREKNVTTSVSAK